MFPEIFSIGGFTLHTYGVMTALGFLAGLALIRKLAQRDKLSVDRVVDLSFLLLVSGILGARILFVITRWEYFSVDPLAIFKIWEGGLVFFGGLILALVVGIYYVRKHKLNVWSTFDVITPGLVMAHMFGRFGCFAAGCCYGKPTSGPFGVRFQSELVDPSLRGVPLHPTQLYEAFSLGVLLLGLLWVHKNRKFSGQVVLTYFATYPIIRSIIEAFRGDEIRGFVLGPISTSQFISIFIFSGAIYVWVSRFKRSRHKI